MNKKNIALKTSAVLMGGLLFTNSSCQKQQQTSESSTSKDTARPNIILIMVDDMGYSDLGCFGSQIQTPNIDRLAEQGIIMPRFYNTGRCCPSRASLLTGLYPHQTGIGDMNHNDHLPGYQGFLNDKCVTIAEVLKNAGYSTLMSGKWHVGNEPEQWPRQRGFEKFFGIPVGGGVYFYPFLKPRRVVLNDTIIHPDTSNFYSTDAFTQYAVDFIDEQKGNNKPFFLYLAHIAPHFPLQACPEDIQKYKGKFKAGFSKIRQQRYQNLLKNGLIDSTYALSEPDQAVLNWEKLSNAEKDSFDLRMAVYAAQLDRVDQGIGKIIRKLEQNEILENTVIMFLSDNGGTHEKSSAFIKNRGAIGRPGCSKAYSRSWANVSNTPFRMYKHWVHEGGVRTPFIIFYPKMIKKHHIDFQLGHIMDILPTCIDLAGAQYPDTFNGNEILPFEGKSLLPVLQGKKRQGHEFLFWEHQGNRAARMGKWKLVSTFDRKSNSFTPWELYNLDIDPTETNNLTNKNSKMVEKLKNAYQGWAKRTGVIPKPELNEIRKSNH